MRHGHDTQGGGQDAQHLQLAALGRQLAAAPPPREGMLTQVRLQSQRKENDMSLIERLFAGRSFAARIALAALVLLVLMAGAVLLPRMDGSRLSVGTVALGATNGAVLIYDVTGLGDPEALQAQLQDVQKQFEADLPEGYEVKLVFSRDKRVERRAHGTEPPVETTVEKTEAMYMLSSDDAEQAQRLQKLIAASLPQLPPARLADATWFSEHGGLFEEGISITLDVDGKQHRFTFPDTAGEAEIEETMRQWFKANHPDSDPQIDVTITSNGAQRQIEVRVESVKRTEPQ